MYGLRASVAVLVAERGLEGYLRMSPQANSTDRTFSH